jgi:YHS domain-containing protein
MHAMQRFRTTLLVTTILAVGLITTAALAQDRPGDQESTTSKAAKLPACPVMGGTIDFSVKTMTEDGPVYFCCPGCIKKLEENPEKYADKVAAQREALAKLPRVQVNCPLSGKPIDRKIFAEHDGEKVYFCSDGCKTAYAQDPTKYRARLADSYTYQTRCPVMGGKINPASYTDLPTGQRIYYCCAGCDRAFLKDPAKYAPKLAEQGTIINVGKLKKALLETHGEHGKP